MSFRWDELEVRWVPLVDMGDGVWMQFQPYGDSRLTYEDAGGALEAMRAGRWPAGTRFAAAPVLWDEDLWVLEGGAP